MNAKLKKELYWILGTILVTLIIGLLLFNDKLFNGRLLDLQVHDTYFVFPKMLFVTAIFTVLLVSMYLNRGIFKGLDNRALSISLILILTVILIGLINYSNWIYGYVKDSGYYLFDERTETEKISKFTMLHWVLVIFILVIVITILTTGYKIIKSKTR